MQILLDTHVALWAITDHKALAEHACSLISNPDNIIFISTVTLWGNLYQTQTSAWRYANRWRKSPALL